MLPVLPLPAPELLAPETDVVFGPDWFRANRVISFGWKAVDAANGYRFTLYSKGSDTPVVSEDALKETGFALRDLSILSKGTFLWNVEARSYDADGELEQPGLIATGSFTIDLPAVKKAASKNGDQVYGR